MKVLVIGGMHGNEQLGIALVRRLQQNPLRDVDALIANPRAVVGQSRFVETDLNRSFGNYEIETYETHRAIELKHIATHYDVVLDFHNTQTPSNNSCFAGVERKSYLGKIATLLKITKGVEATYDCINKHCANVLSLEISNGDLLDNATYWYEAISVLANSDIAMLPQESIEWYRYMRRITWHEKNRFNFNGWRPFVPLQQRDLNKLQIKCKTVVPIFVGSTLTEYYATLLTKIT